MVILSPTKPLLQLELSDRSRKFALDDDDDNKAIIVPTYSKARHFEAIEAEICPPWPEQCNDSPRIFTTPAIRIDDGKNVKEVEKVEKMVKGVKKVKVKKVKIEKIVITMKPGEVEDQLKKLSEATKSTQGNWLEED
ncbi:hypothetical protein CEP54_012365 [Fusarium duplospermum]|uniref:Uncharacterized protein n=1 Tax=Fusarium duplospermum TaxID=1325734 RepID=A0A428P9A0_9HYPO|nr:hypothetical protein CEP54_012365 [Fusarium duplospermum]